MKKSELISAIASELKAPKTRVIEFVDALELVAARALKREGVVVLPGLLKLIVVKTPPRTARKARNPRSGAEMTIPAKPAGKKLRARFAKSLKQAVGQLPPSPKKK